MFDDNNPAYPGGGALGALLKSHQLFSLIENTKLAQQDAQLRQQNFQRETANDKWLHDRDARLDQQAQANQNRDDIDRVLAAGGVQVHPGTFFSQFLMPRAEKIGENYYSRPDPQYVADRNAQRELDKHRREKEIDAEVADRNAQEFPLDAFFPNQPAAKGRTVKLRPENVAGFLNFANNAATHGQFNFHTITPDGAVHIFRSGPDGTKEEIRPNAGTPPTHAYSDRDKNAANLRALQWWKQTYPNGKTSDEFERAAQAYANDNQVGVDEARRALSSSKRARDRYGVSEVYITDPKKDIEFQQKQGEFLEQGGGQAGAGAAGAGQPKGATAPAAPRIDPKKATAQVDQYARMQGLTDQQRATLETELARDLMASGIVRSDADARAYIKRKLGGAGGASRFKFAPAQPGYQGQ
ncbi:MAG TPA: hypothetical protein VJ464_16815 [Blastocatellia bacterium]|nr:hypothetical protein [Blastocatellia bacterium]